MGCTRRTEQDPRPAALAAPRKLHAPLMVRLVYYIDEKGERVFLDDASHKAEIERMRELVRENCEPD